MTDQDAVRLDIEGTIATVLLNRPEAMNALNQDVFMGLREAAQSIKENPDIRVAILTGAGEKETEIQPQLTQPRQAPKPPP